MYFLFTSPHSSSSDPVPLVTKSLTSISMTFFRLQIQKIMEYLPLSVSFNIHMSVIFIVLFSCNWILILYHVVQKDAWYDFTLKFIEACFVSQHIVSSWECSIRTWEQCIFCCFGKECFVFCSNVSLKGQWYFVNFLSRWSIYWCQSVVKLPTVIAVDFFIYIC